MSIHVRSRRFETFNAVITIDHHRKCLFEVSHKRKGSRAPLIVLVEVRNDIYGQGRVRVEVQEAHASRPTVDERPRAAHQLSDLTVLIFNI